MMKKIKNILKLILRAYSKLQVNFRLFIIFVIIMLIAKCLNSVNIFNRSTTKQYNIEYTHDVSNDDSYEYIMIHSNGEMHKVPANNNLLKTKK